MNELEESKTIILLYLNLVEGVGYVLADDTTAAQYEPAFAVYAAVSS